MLVLRDESEKAVTDHQTDYCVLFYCSSVIPKAKPDYFTFVDLSGDSFVFYTTILVALHSQKKCCI